MTNYNVGFGYYSTDIEEFSAKFVKSNRPKFQRLDDIYYYDNPQFWFGFDEEAGYTYYNNKQATLNPSYNVTAADVGEPFNIKYSHVSRRVPAGVTKGFDTLIRGEDFKQLSFEFFFKSSAPAFVPIAYAPVPTDADISGGQTQFSEYISASSNRAVSLTVQNMNGAHRLAFAFTSLEVADGIHAGPFVTGGSKRMHALSNPVDTKLFDDKWHHVVAVWNGKVGTKNYQDMFDFYIDGADIGVASGEVVWDFFQNPDGTWEVPLMSTDRQFIVTGTVGSVNEWNAPYAVQYDGLLMYDQALTASMVSERLSTLGQIGTIIEEDQAQPFATFTNGILRTTTEFDQVFPFIQYIEPLEITAESSVTIEYTPIDSDSLKMHQVLPESGAINVSLVDTDLEAGEPNTGGYTGTRWYAIPFDFNDNDRVFITLADQAGGSTAEFTVYRQPGLAFGDDPTMASLVLYQSSDDSRSFELDTSYDGMYFIQVGLISGDGDGLVMAWGSADPGPGGTFDGAIDIEGLVGAYPPVMTTNAVLEVGEPSVILSDAKRTIWYRWQAPETPGPIVWTVIGDNLTQFGFEMFSGTDFSNLVLEFSTASDYGMAIQPTVEFEPGEVYYFRISTVTELGVPFRLSWSPPRKEFVPQEPVSHLRVTVHAGVTGGYFGGRLYEANEQITELPNRMGAQFQEALNVPGSGSLTLLQDDPIMRSFNPSYWPLRNEDPWGNTQVQWSQDPYDLVRFGNIVKFWMNEECVSAFLIRSREVSIVDGGENAARTITVTGPTVHYLLNDFIVEHARSEHNKEERQFDWTSIAGNADKWANGGWFDPGDGLDWSTNKRAWNHPINHAGVKNPPGWENKKTEPAKERPKYDLVRKKKPAWPDDTAKWIWMDEKKEINQTNFPPARIKIDGYHFYRTKVLNIDKDDKQYKFSVHSDTAYWVYLDGELFMSGNGNENYSKFKVKRVFLEKGSNSNNPHTIAVFVDDRKETVMRKVKGKKRKVKKKIDLDHNDSFIMTVWRLNAKGKPVEKIINTNKNQWYAWHGEDPPGWSRAMVLRQIILEARERGNQSAQALKLGSNFGQKSEEGSKWWDEKKFNTSIEVGTTCLDVQASYSETAQFDVWVDPKSLRVVTWQGGKNGQYPRGENKSANVALVPGSNLINWTVSEVDELKNRALIQYKGGYTYAENEASITKNGQRDGFMEFGIVNTAGAAELLGDAVLSSIATTSSLGGSGEIVGHRNETYSGSVIPVRGAVPFLDWNVGDSVSAPSSNGVMRPHRVLSLSCTEDESGQLTFDPELEAWAVIMDTPVIPPGGQT